MVQHVSGFPSFLRLNNIILYVYTTFSFPSICQWILESNLLADMNNSSMNMGVWQSLQDLIFNCFRYISRRRISGSYGILFLNFLGIHILFSIAAVTFHIPTNSAQICNFSTASAPLLFFIVVILIGLRWKGEPFTYTSK
jgi:hypothetical protein